MKQLGTALMIYAADHDDRLATADSWGATIRPLVKDDRSFNDLTYDPLPYRFGFAFFDPMAGKSLGQIAAPNKAVLLFQTDLRDLNAHGSLSMLPAKPRGGDGMDIFCFADTSAKRRLRSDVEPEARLNIRSQH